MDIKRDFSNKLLQRRELEVAVERDSNPGFEKAKEMIVEKFKPDKDLVVVKKVASGFGSNLFVIDAFIYDNAESMTRIEPKKKEKKGGGKS